MTETTTVMHDGPPVWTDERGVVCLRASALGMCTRAAVARFQGYDAMLPPEQMQARYDDGHLHENSTLRKMEEQQDVEIQAQQEKVVLVVLPGKLEIHGHVDGRVVSPGAEGAIAEAKAFSDSMFKQYLAKGGPGEIFGYGMQAVVYMLAAGTEQILYGVKNKNSGKVDSRWFDIADPTFPTKAEVFKRAMEFYKAVTDAEANVSTMTCDRTMFPCPVFYLHEETARVEVEDVVLKGLLVDYKTAQQQESAAKARKDEIGLEIADRMQVIGEEELEVLGWKATARVGNSSAVDWATIESLTGRKKADFTTVKPNSKATVTVTPPKGWTPGQGELL